jgi:hypothetical protein
VSFGVRPQRIRHETRLNAYSQALKRRLQDRTRWPDFPDAEFLDRLDRAAERALAKRTVEGYLAAVLIYHQLVEEIFRLLLSDAQFHVQLAIFPTPIKFIDRPKKMFGQLQQQLQETLDFPSKDRLLKKSNQLNSLRIGFVHKLTRRASLAGVAKEARKMQRIYGAIFADFEAAHDNFRLIFHDFEKDMFVD